MENHRIAIVTDSTCDIPQALLERYSIFVQPHLIIWGERQYRDRVDLMPEEFYRRLASESGLPTTSQASAQDFLETFQRAIDQGAEQIVAFLLNTKFSGAIQSARLAAEKTPVPVTIHDTHGATMGEGWQVLAAARVREAGGGVPEMLEAAERARQSMQLYIALDTLEYVYRGGRIGNARRMVGNMLNVKPLIQVDHRQGTVEPVGMALTRRKSLDLLFNKFFAHFDRSRPLRVAVLHGDAAADAAALYERVREEIRPVELLTNITCPILGIHTGPKAVALCGYSE